MNADIIGKLKELDSRRLQVTLGDFSYAEIHADKRTSVRVRLKLPMNVQLLVDGNQVAGVIRDIAGGNTNTTSFVGVFQFAQRNESVSLRALFDNFEFVDYPAAYSNEAATVTPAFTQGVTSCD